MKHSASLALCFAGSVLLVQRKDGSWCFPGGRAEPREDPLTTALREFEEEVGVEVQVTLDSLRYGSPEACYEGSTKKGRPHYLFIGSATKAPLVIGVQEEELLDFDWVRPSTALQGRPLHHGVERNLVEMIDDPRFLTL